MICAAGTQHSSFLIIYPNRIEVNFYYFLFIPSLSRSLSSSASETIVYRNRIKNATATTTRRKCQILINKWQIDWASSTPQFVTAREIQKQRQTISISLVKHSVCNVLLQYWFDYNSYYYICYGITDHMTYDMHRSILMLILGHCCC